MTNPRRNHHTTRTNRHSDSTDDTGELIVGFPTTRRRRRQEDRQVRFASYSTVKDVPSVLTCMQQARAVVFERGNNHDETREG